MTSTTISMARLKAQSSRERSLHRAAIVEAQIVCAIDTWHFCWAEKPREEWEYGAESVGMACHPRI